MMIPFEVLPSIDVGGLVGLWLGSGLPVEKRVADALIRLSSCPSPDWEEAASLAEEEGVCVELSLEQLALLLERLDFGSGRAHRRYGVLAERSRGDGVARVYRLRMDKRAGLRLPRVLCSPMDYPRRHGRVCSLAGSARQECRAPG